MPEPVEVTDVRMVEMPSDRMTPAMAHSGVSWYLLTITLRNRSEAPLHIIGDIRRIRYDAGQRALVVQLSEQQPPSQNPALGMPAPPRYQEIRAGEETSIVHPISSPITFLETNPDGTRRSREVRLPEDVDSVECTIAYETEQPSVEINLAARMPRERWRESKTTVTASRRSPLSRTGRG
jgi:hypothetical protein